MLVTLIHSREKNINYTEKNKPQTVGMLSYSLISEGFTNTTQLRIVHIDTGNRLDGNVRKVIMK